MIRRHFTADSLNIVVNHPTVYEWGRGAMTGRLDLTPVVKNTNNYLLMGEYGGVLFLKHSPGVYEAHTQVLPDGRGKWALTMVHEALEWMFTRTDCVDIMTRVPKGNLAARALARAISGTCEYRMQNGWVLDGELVYADVFSLQIQTWMAKAPGLEAHGQKFHDDLEKEYARFDKSGPNHPEDHVHDRYVGAASLMVRNGQPFKAVVFYNRWAGMAGYAPIQIVSDDPVIVDIQESLLQVSDKGDFFVLRMKQ